MNFVSRTIRRVFKVASAPATATEGDVYYNSATHALNVATAANTWSALGTGSSSLTNGAGANVVPKSNGTNLVTSQITDNGTTVGIAEAAGKSISIGGVDASGIFVSGYQVQLGDTLPHTNGTQIVIDDNAQLVSITGGLSVSGLLGAAGLTTSSNIISSPAAGSNVGHTNFPFGSLIIGNAAGNTSQVTGTFTANRVATLPDSTGTVALVGVNLGTILPVHMANGTHATATGTVYSSPGTTLGLTATTEGTVSFAVPRAGTIRNLYVRTGTTAKSNTPTTVVTVRKNGVDQALTLTMTQTVSTTSSDTTHSFSVVAGDLITISFVTTGASGVSTSIAGVSIQLD